MRKNLVAVVIAAVGSFMGMAPRANAAPGDSINFAMVRATGATCLPAGAHGRVTVSDLGPVQNLHVELFDLTPKNEFTLFVTQHSARPFGLSWYQGDIVTDENGRGVGDFTGIFSAETFIFGDSAIPMAHLAMWFADPADAAKAGCSSIVTPFDGDHEAGILVLSTVNFPDNHGPLLNLGAE